QQQNVENARNLIHKINTSCFEKCVSKPGSDLSQVEEKCIRYCLTKYLSAWNKVSAIYIARIKSDPSSN
ncbi:Tim10/DDP family zinc finger protein, partial [Trichophaea hybrida]